MDDVRYSEFLFLRALATGSIELFNNVDGGAQATAIGITHNFYGDLAATLLEDLYVRFDDQKMQHLVARLRGELSPNVRGRIPEHLWDYPREALSSALTAATLQRIRITYRGLRRIEELRDLLRRDRILEPFGVLLSIQYFRTDFEDALRRASDVAVSVIYADMDNFKRINTEFGHGAGDAVMKAYLEVVRDSLGLLGTGYRGRGDEVIALIVGQGHKCAIELAEKIRSGVESMCCEHNGKKLPRVTSSLGVATTPPAERATDVETLAEGRQQRAKESGKNQVVGT